MDTLLIIFQTLFLIMGIFGVVSSSVSSFASMKIAAVIYFMSVVISFHRDSWLPLIIGLIALLIMRFFGFEPTGEDACDNARHQLGLDDLSTKILSGNDDKLLPKKRPPTQQEFWDGIRASGVTQEEINERMRAMPRLPQSDLNIIEQEIIKATLFESEYSGINLIHYVMLPLSKIKFMNTFKDYHHYTEYVNLANLIQELIDPDILNRLIPPEIEDIYHIFDQDKEYIFSYSEGKKVHFIESPLPVCKFS